jgi:hypothetical protein
MPTPHHGSEPLISEVRKSQLSPARKRLVLLLQSVVFGRIERLVIRNGEPVLDGDIRPRIVRTYRAGTAPGRRNAARPLAAPGEDFVLRKELRDLLAWLDTARNGVIERLEVVDGLPSFWDAEESTHIA